MDALDLVSTAVGFLTAAALIGAPLFVWRRSTLSAILASSAGGVMLLTQLTYVLLARSQADAVAADAAGFRVARTLLALGSNTLYFGLLIASVVVLARRRP